VAGNLKLVLFCIFLTGNREPATGTRKPSSNLFRRWAAIWYDEGKGWGKMRVRFFKPFDEISGRDEMDLDLKGPVQVKEVLGAIEKKVPTFQRYLRKEKDEVLNFFVVFVRGDEILKLNDWVQDQDTVKILPPISGG